MSLLNIALAASALLLTCETKALITHVQLFYIYYIYMYCYIDIFPVHTTFVAHMQTKKRFQMLKQACRASRWR